jgi:hypothetical protein
LPTKKITIHGGKLPSYYDIEERLLKYLETNWKLGNAISISIYSLIYEITRQTLMQDKNQYIF